MPMNKNALTRYKIIDYLFGQLGGSYTLEQLINAVNDRLELDLGKGSGIKRSTLEKDIRTMRSPFPEGFNAPIVNHWGTGVYEYSDKSFSIYNLHLSHRDKQRLRDALSILDQLEGLPHYENLREIMAKLRLFEGEDEKSRQIVFFEESHYPGGNKWLKPLHNAILDKKSLRITYAPFSDPKESHVVFPYFLKEYRNRWYIYGWVLKAEAIYNLALDRIDDIAPSLASFEDHRDESLLNSLRSIVGVTLPENTNPVKILLRVKHPTLSYLLTKPLHHSQKLVQNESSTGTLEYFLLPNFEFKAEIMRLAQSIQVLEPDSLKTSIENKLKSGLDLNST
jgi:predicted DNA-binding transcriptional regulator YafY